MTNGIDYLRWKKEHEPILKKLRGREIFFLFSAGKDSSLAMYLLLKAGEDFGFSFQAHAGAFPAHRYDQKERKRISAYWEGKGIVPVWHELQETDVILESEEKPCLACQSIRKKVLRGFLSKQVKDWQNLVIVTSYSLWDLVSYAVEQMLTNLLGEVHEEQREANERRKMETMQRFHPFLRMNEGYAVFRPLVRYNGIDIEREIEKNGIPTLKIPCRFSDQRPKRLLEKYYGKLGTGFDYDLLVEFAKKCLSFPDPSEWVTVDRDKYLGEYF